jgi:hypothetical protein
MKKTEQTITARTCIVMKADELLLIDMKGAK